MFHLVFVYYIILNPFLSKDVYFLLVVVIYDSFLGYPISEFYEN